jgi:hypothetical protein
MIHILPPYVSLDTILWYRTGEGLNGCHLKELQDKTKSKREFENVYKLAFSTKV